MPRPSPQRHDDPAPAPVAPVPPTLPESPPAGQDPSAGALLEAAGRLAAAAARLLDAAGSVQDGPSRPHGLLQYRPWWELVEAVLCVGGRLITGMPIFVQENVLRVVNQHHSYFIPLDKVDYIRTDDGLCPDASPARPEKPAP